MWSIMTNYVPNVHGDIPPSLMVLFTWAGFSETIIITSEYIKRSLRQNSVNNAFGAKHTGCKNATF